ncbi:YbaB/EbfC family nucleoid-associated protein [Kutzneria sp. CA-103260]|uniref:YbaB/EbfC family nucleoid-associated protein n=1 Tax=Kutzneria sp. CA-103260 TaxID=2802641 RepID=UPI001BA77720|nr:YbaB/EbfC family nucleoid-associated protein [Kutzneria sp. CA-103260]QUQ69361.1 Nucleoid-associated protein YbaB [Kutzneria sp. CA-103260]
MSETAQQLLARIEAIDTAAAENRMRAESYQRMADELQNAEGRATSPDGLVTVVAGPGGSVTSIVFDDRISTITPQALSASVMHAIAQARASAAQQQAEVVRRGLGDTELLDRVLDSDARLFGDTRPSAPAPAPAAAPARSRDRYDDQSFEDSGVLSEESF